MFKRITFQKLFYRFLPAIFVLLVACSTQEGLPATSTPVPTDILAATPTPEPTDTPLPTQTEAPTETPLSIETPLTEAQPTEVEERPDITILLQEGDPERGKKLALKWRCFTCHVTNESAPRLGVEQGLPAMLARAELRIADTVYSGFATTPEQYLIESVIDPSVYVVEGDWKSAMDDIYDVELSEKDLADVIAWILTVE